MQRHLILHIGLSKTGSSSIQRVLADQRDALQAQGMYMFRSPGWAIHALLPASLVNDPKILWGFHPGTWEGLTPAARIARFREEWAAELAELPGWATRCLITAEQIGGLLRADNEVQRLAGALAPFFASVRVVAYLRRQDQHAASAYSQDLRTGIMNPPGLPAGGPAALPQYDYGNLLDRWARVFGDAAIVGRIFERGALKGGDAVEDFLAIAGVTVPALQDNPDRNSNPSIALAGQELLRQAGAIYAAQGNTLPWRDTPAWRRLTSSITETMPGGGWRPTRAEASAFMDRFAATNEHARARFFPGRATLFEEGFADLPDSPPQLTPQDVASAALAALMHEVAISAKRQAEAAMTQFRLHRRLGEKGAMRNCLIRAVRFDPDLLEARLSLTDLFIEEGDTRLAREHAEAALRLAPNHPRATRLERLTRPAKVA